MLRNKQQLKEKHSKERNITQAIYSYHCSKVHHCQVFTLKVDEHHLNL